MGSDSSVEEILQILVRRKKEGLLPEDFLSEEKSKELLTSILDTTCYEEDGPVESWLLRVAHWGKITIVHREDSHNKEWQQISVDDFFNQVNDKLARMAYCGWTTATISIDKIKFYRVCKEADRTERTEEFMVNIALKPDLLKIHKKKNSWLGKLGF